jgi:ankyrin
MNCSLPAFLVLLLGTFPARAEFDWKEYKNQYDEAVRIAARYPLREFEKAVEDGDVKTVTRLLDEGVPVNLQIPWPQEQWEGIPPCQQVIHIAAANNHLEVVRLLLDRGADPKAHGYENNPTPLHLTRNIEIAKLLLAHGANTTARDFDGGQPIHSAACHAYLENRRGEAVAQNLSFIKLLIKHGADPLAEDNIKRQPIHIAANYGTAEVVGFFLDHKARVDAKTKSNRKDSAFADLENGWQPLHYAASRVNFVEPPECTEGTKIVELLIRKGADVNAITGYGATPLHLSSNAATTRLLLEHGARVNAVNRDGETPLHCSNNAAITRLLLDQQAKDELLKHSAEHLADTAQAGDLETIRTLVAIGAKTNQLWKGLLPIHHAVGSGKEQVVQYFLATGQAIDAKCTVQDEESSPPIIDTDFQPIHVAAVAHSELLPFLIKSGAKIDAPTGKGWQPIHFAAVFGDAASLRAIIKAEGDPSAKNHDGKTPLQLAEELGKTDCVNFLKQLKSTR